MKEITLEAVVENLHTLFSFITKELKAVGAGGKDIRLVKLCAEEAFVNIANYAYSPSTGKARITMDIDCGSPAKLCLSFYDWGTPFNPLYNAAIPDITKELDERPIGGLGVYLLKTQMDHVTYEYRDKQNVLTMTKHLLIPTCQ